MHNHSGPLLLAVDIGTTHCKAGLFGPDGACAGLASVPTPVSTAPRGFRVIDPETLWTGLVNAIKKLVQDTGRADIAGIGIASMAETGLAIDRATGAPRSALLPWFDTAAGGQVAAIREAGAERERFLVTGIYPSFKCSLAKILWAHRELGVDLRGAVWLSAADYLAYRLCGRFATDYSLAGRTYAFQIAEKAWDTTWIEAFGLSADLFPEAVPAGRPLGLLMPEIARGLGLPAGLPVCIAGHDHICATLAVGATRPGVVLDSMGTAEALNGVLPAKPLGEVEFQSGFSIGCHVVPGQFYWQGGLSTSGGSIEWLRGLLPGRELSYAEVDACLAGLPEGPGDLLFFPYLAGSGTPHFDPGVYGAFIGLRATHRLGDLIKAALEGAAYEVEFMRRQAQHLTGSPIERIIATGGGVRTHKARMNYWWDFCPRMVHQGIWEPVILKVCGPAVLEDVFVRPVLSENLDQTSVRVEWRVSSAQAAGADLDVILRLGQEIVAREHLRCTLPAGQSIQVLQLNIAQPELWWPNGYGRQPLYTAEVSLHTLGAGESALSGERQLNFGIRQVRFVPNEGAPSDALPYTLEVNRQRIYVNGWNWVPMDAYYGVERPQKLNRLLALAQAAHVNLLRVWGGGLIEKDAFYGLCDQLGILVWQEFIQSSSGIDNTPPGDPEFIGQMVAEARQIIPGRRNHPSLAIWCGGNELTDPDGRPSDDRQPLLAALHQVVSELDPDRTWLPTSASGPVAGNSLQEIEKDPTRLHDVHGPWEYQGLEQHYTLYNRGASLYHSEFGVEGLTNLSALNAVIAPEHQLPLDLNNPAWFHVGAWWLKTDMWRSVFGEFKEIRQAVRGTQFLQFEGLRYALEANRRRWPHNSGSSPWQFNEPFPMGACTSAVDYFGDPKPAYAGVRSAYEPLHLSARYATLAWAGRTDFEAELWTHHNGAGQPAAGQLSWQLAGLNGQVFQEGSLAVSVPANQSVYLAQVRCPLAQISGPLFFLTLALRDQNSGETVQNRYLFSATENLAPVLELPPAELSVHVEKEESRWLVSIRNIGPSAAMYLWLSAELDPATVNSAYFSQNYISLLPGKPGTDPEGSDAEEVAIIVIWKNQPEAARALRLEGWNVPEMRLG